MLDVLDLPPAKRAKRNRRLAESAVRAANKATGAARVSYLINSRTVYPAGSGRRS